MTKLVYVPNWTTVGVIVIVLTLGIVLNSVLYTSTCQQSQPLQPTPTHTIPTTATRATATSQQHP